MAREPAASSMVVGRDALARMYGRGPAWAASILRQWWEEDERAGPAAERRVFRRKRNGGRPAYYTTLAALHRHMPPARDMALVRAVESLSRDLDFAARRLTILQSRVEQLEAKTRAAR